MNYTDLIFDQEGTACAIEAEYSDEHESHCRGIVDTLETDSNGLSVLVSGECNTNISSADCTEETTISSLDTISS